MQAIADEVLQDTFAYGIEIGAVLDTELDPSLVTDPEDLRELGIEEKLAVI